MQTDASPFFVTGGTLRYDARCYVERQCDRHLYERLQQGEFCFVLTSRQMGKSSLMVHTANRLRQAGWRTVVLDLTTIGQNVTAEQWYGGLMEYIGQQLRVDAEMEDFWRQHEHLGPVHRLCSAIQEVALPRLAGHLVIFIDEIDAVRSLPFAVTEFFGAIRGCYNRRMEESSLERLTFCLLGACTPAELTNDPFTTPFNVGHRIELHDFTPEEAVGLSPGLGREEPAAAAMLRRILEWTHGHPYLTQRLCQAVAQDPAAQGAPEVDRWCEELFLSPGARERDDNLLFVRQRMLQGGADLSQLLALYHRILQSHPVAVDDNDPLQDHLRLSGISRKEGGHLRVRNRIYEEVFDPEWIQANQPATLRQAQPSVAVLPFSNLSANPDNDYLSDGLTEDLISSLSKIAGLRVSSPVSAFVFKGKPLDLRLICEQLAVDHVVQGSVRCTDNRLQLQIQLVNVAQAVNLWSESYDQQMGRIFAITDEITSRVLESLQVSQGIPAPGASAKRSTSNAQAYQLYLKGRYYWNQRGLGLMKGVHYFELALLEDPAYALAYSGLADSYILLGFYGCLPNHEAYPKAKAAALKSLAVDDQLAEAFCSLGMLTFMHDWDFAAAEIHFRKAIELDPQYVPAHYWYASCLSAVNRMEEALAEDQRAIGLDPLSVYARTQLAWILFRTRQYDLAISHLRQVLELDSSFMMAHWLMGQAYAFTYLLEEAIAEFQHALALSGHNPWLLAWLGFAFALAGRSAEAQEILTQLKDPIRHPYLRPFLPALVCTGLDLKDETFEWLEKAWAEREEWLAWLHLDPAFDRLKSDPRFAAFLNRVQVKR